MNNENKIDAIKFMLDDEFDPIKFDLENKIDAIKLTLEYSDCVTSLVLTSYVRSMRYDDSTNAIDQMYSQLRDYLVAIKDDLCNENEDADTNTIALFSIAYQLDAQTFVDLMTRMHNMTLSDTVYYEDCVVNASLVNNTSLVNNSACYFVCALHKRARRFIDNSNTEFSLVEYSHIDVRTFFNDALARLRVNESLTFDNKYNEDALAFAHNVTYTRVK